MIPHPSATAQTIKEKFLEDNSKYSEIQGTTPSLGNFCSINDDDEVWLLQCPKGTDPSLLKDQKLKLPGRSVHDEFETVAIEYPEPVSHAFGHKNKKGQNSIKILPIQGNVLLRKRIKTDKAVEEVNIEALSERVPMPRGIKERHPLLGSDFTSKLELDPEIADRLKQADAVSSRTSSKKKKSKKKKNKEASTLDMDSDGDVQLVMQKKPKKNKRKHSETTESDSSKKPKKKKKNSISEDISEDLLWLQNL